MSCSATARLLAMEPNRLGRVLGAGTRIAADKLRERAAQAMANPPTTSSTEATAASPRIPSAPKAASYAEGAGRLARGAGRFGASMWRPFAHATGVLWLQVTGVFFSMFTLFFVVHASQLYRAAGWHNRRVIAYAAFALLFAWFAVTSFWRAQRRQKKG
jgi:hypothetical protein